MQNSVSLDLCIVDIRYLYNGLGPIIIKIFEESFLSANYEYIIVDPAINNIAAINAYKKSGFLSSNIISNNTDRFIMIKKIL